MFQYLGLAVILCGCHLSCSHLFFDSTYTYREPRSVQSSGGHSPIRNFFNPLNLYPSLSSQYLQAQRGLLLGNRRRYRHPVVHNDKPIVKEPRVIPDPVHHTESHIDPLPKPEPQQQTPVAQPTEPVDKDPECIQGCEVNIAPEKCHCAAHLCDTVSCTDGNACRLVTVGGLVEGTCLPIDSTTGIAPGQNEITHSISGCGLNLNQGSPCGRAPIQRFHFDLNTQSCLPFQYSGCGGNDNNYGSLTSCETTCQSQHISPGVIDHHNSPTDSLPTVSQGHSHPDHIEPVGSHGHGHPVIDHHEPVPQAEPQPQTQVVQPTEPVDKDPECIQGCEVNIAPEKCHCAAHLCDTVSCTGGNACRLVTVGGLVEGTCLPIDSTTGIAPGQNEITHSISGCGLNLNQGSPCGRAPIQRFHFDLNTQSCLPFQYSGCGGNDNNYGSLTSCETTCQSQHISPGVIDHHNSPTGSLPTVSQGHSHPDHIEPVGSHGHEQHGGPIVNHDIKLPVSGNDPPECQALCKKALVPENCHCSEHLCDRITCIGNNVCRLMREMGRVEAMCIPVNPTTGKSVVDHQQKPGIPNACGKPRDRGRCGPFGNRRYYFDLERQACRQFRYSGCGGNANRFMTKQACEEMCMETRSSPGIIDHHNDPSLDPALILGQPTHHSPTEHNPARGIDQHHTGRILSPLIPGRLAIFRHGQPDTGHVDNSHSNHHSAGTRIMFNGMNIRSLMGQLLTRPSTSSTFGLTALNRPRYGYRRRPLGTTRVAQASKA